VAFRFIAGNEHPDYDTIATIRKCFLLQIWKQRFTAVPKSTPDSATPLRRWRIG
jgi:hypothetical protein